MLIAAAGNYASGSPSQSRFYAVTHMDYKALLKWFWMLDAEHGYSGSEAKLYLYLLRHAADAGPTFALSDRQAGAMTGVSEKVFRGARNRLHETGLVRVEVGGSAGRGSRTHYELVAPERKKGGQKLPPFQERKVSPLHPPSKERNTLGAEHSAHARESPAEGAVNPQIRPPTEEEIKGFAAIAGIDPELAIAAAEGCAAVGWIDKHGRPYLDWRSPVKQGARIRANDKAKESRNGHTQKASSAGAGRPDSTDYQRRRDGRSVGARSGGQGYW